MHEVPTTQTTAEDIVCTTCELPKPVEAFYASEVQRTGRSKPSSRCKKCFRKRIGAQNKRQGRQSTSLSFQEVVWLDKLLRTLPSSELRQLARHPEYIKLANKTRAMKKRGAEAMNTPDTQHKELER